GDSVDAVKEWIAAGAVVASAQTTCDDFQAGTADTLGEVDYTAAKGKISQGLDPRAFNDDAKITTTAPIQVVSFSPSHDSTTRAAMYEMNAQTLLWSNGCPSKTNGTETGGGSGASFTVPVPGDYVIAMKFRTKSLAKTTASAPADVTYSFTTSLGGNTSASVLLRRQ